MSPVGSFNNKSFENLGLAQVQYQALLDGSYLQSDHSSAGNLLLQNFKKREISLQSSSKQPMSLQMLDDRERFTVAKNHGTIAMLLELIQSDESCHATNSTLRKSMLMGNAA